MPDQSHVCVNKSSSFKGVKLHGQTVVTAHYTYLVAETRDQDNCNGLIGITINLSLKHSALHLEAI